MKKDNVNHPDHYAGESLECIDVMRLAFGDRAVRDFCRCNAFKYLWRHKKKGGMEDVKKAEWYCNYATGELGYARKNKDITLRELIDKVLKENKKC